MLRSIFARMSLEHLDVLIVGAGISGIGAAYHLSANCPSRTYAVLEGRDDLGGTWDLFHSTESMLAYHSGAGDGSAA